MSRTLTESVELRTQRWSHAWTSFRLVTALSASSSRAFLISCLSTLLVLPCRAEDSSPWGDWPAWGDLGNGSYHNPVLPADFSDVDCIRVGDAYYAISSTFQFSPGVIVLKSADLVNWQIIGHAVSDLTQISPELNWDRMNRYGRGIWAGAIRYHAGKFWIYFGTPDEGYFMTTATDAQGPWEPLHCVMRADGWDDPCPFWDDDGKAYLVGTHFRAGYQTYLLELTPDGREIVKKPGILLNSGAGREANKLYKFDGRYYHFFSEHKSRTGRYVMMQRADSIAGPYSAPRQLSHASREAMEPNQGGIVQTQHGDWYFLTHHGTGAWEGRCMSLLPVTWTDGWPILGTVGSDGIGTMAWSGPMPIAGSQPTAHQTSDDFAGNDLAPQWEWNYQPRQSKWSLSERPGYLRLHAFSPLSGKDLKRAGNTLTQRSMRTRHNEVTAALELGGIADGQFAGLCHFSKNYSMLGVRRQAGVTTLECRSEAATLDGPVISDQRIWLRSQWGADGESIWSYSTDGSAFTRFGEPYRMGWGHYRGDRIGLYSFNVDGEAGYLDVDSFEYRVDSSRN